MRVTQEDTIEQVKEVIEKVNNNLGATMMSLSCAGVALEDKKKIKDYAMIKNGVVLIQAKAGLD